MSLDEMKLDYMYKIYTVIAYISVGVWQFNAERFSDQAL